MRYRKFTRQDIRTKVDWINNEIINSSMFFELPATIEKTNSWYEKNIGNESRLDITLLVKNEIIGFAGLTNIQKNNSNAEFYIMINPKEHGKGYGKQLSKWVYNYGFSILNLNKIYLYTNNHNERAYKLYENLGFQLEGILRCHKRKGDIFLDRRVYGMLKNDWSNLLWADNNIKEL